MADHSPPETTPPDYELADRLDLTEPAQYRALFEETRTKIVGLLLERAATTSELAEVLGKPKGTIGHHLKTLERAGLVRVVRTRRVRALEAKYYGRTARTFYFDHVAEAVGISERVLSTAAAEIAGVPAEHADLPATANIRYARIPADRAEAWAHRVGDLLTEFAHEPRGGDVTYALVIGVYPTGRAALTETAAATETDGDAGARGPRP